jgi:hypothetical protein
VAELFAPVCSIAATRRRRFLWAAWWTGPPAREPFRKPDASSGGARTRADAMRDAERAAGCRLIEIEGDWARAWARVLLGEPPFPRSASADERPPAPRRPAEAASPGVWSTLGIGPSATVDEIKRAFRKRALETHPDRGGDPDAFRSVRSAYEQALARRARPRKKRS